MAHSYSTTDIVDAFRKVGLTEGDSVFVHADLSYFGLLEGATSGEDYTRAFSAAFAEVLGKTGNLYVPAFTYSFCHGERFDVEATSSDMGAFAEYLRKADGSVRSRDANFSVVGRGPDTATLLRNAPPHSFGPDCFWERFIAAKGKFCHLNIDFIATFFHYVEKILNVPYRYDKAFDGFSRHNGEWKKETYVHYVRDLEKPGTFTDPHLPMRAINEAGLMRIAALGAGSVAVYPGPEAFAVCKKYIDVDPFFFTMDNAARVAGITCEDAIAGARRK